MCYSGGLPMDNLPNVSQDDELKPEHYITREECQEMIDDAINLYRNAGIISMFVGFFVLGLFSEGLLRLLVPFHH